MGRLIKEWDFRMW